MSTPGSEFSAKAGVGIGSGLFVAFLPEAIAASISLAVRADDNASVFAAWPFWYGIQLHDGQQLGSCSISPCVTDV